VNRFNPSDPADQAELIVAISASIAEMPDDDTEAVRLQAALLDPFEE
jgi:hypothetical protein